ERDCVTLDERHPGHIESKPRHERIAAPVGPNLRANRGLMAQSARMKAHRVGHHERILGYGEDLGLAESDAAQCLDRDPQRPPCGLEIRTLPGRYRSPPFPSKTPPRRPVRTRYVDERPLVFAHIA